MHIKICLFFIALTVSYLGAQSVGLSGKVSNKSGKPISGAIVSLESQKLKDTTDATGAYSLKGTTFVTNAVPIAPGTEKISLKNGMVHVGMAKPAPITIEMYDMKGKLLERVLDLPVSAGDYRFDLAARKHAANIMITRISIGRNTSTVRFFSGNGLGQSMMSLNASSSSAERLAKVQSVVDSVIVTAASYLSSTTAISSYQGEVNVTLDTMTLGKFSFFVTSLKGLQTLSGNTKGFGGDLRFGKTGQGAGLLGADSICQCLAEKSMPGSKVKIWRAFLSVAKDANGNQVNAIDRIGSGPWYDRLGNLLSNTKSDLLNERPNAAAAIKNDLPNEYGVPNHQPDPTLAAVDNHQFITGTGTDGKLYSSTATCRDWTSAAADTANKPRCGLSWPQSMGGAGGKKHWISIWDLWGCEAGLDLTDNDKNGTKGVYTIGNGGGYGGFYCFALNP